MKKEEKSEVINSLADQLGTYMHFYLADISGLNAEQTSALRRSCFEKDVKLVVVKNTLLNKALEQIGKADAEIVSVLEGSTSIMFSNTGNAPAKLIKSFRKEKGGDVPALKAAYVDDCVYMGEVSLEQLVNLKSREELLGDIVSLLQSPAKNVISALQASAGGKISGLVKALENRAQ